METSTHIPDPEEEPEISSDSFANAASAAAQEAERSLSEQDTDQFVLPDIAPEATQDEEPGAPSATPTGEYAPTQFASLEPTPELPKADAYPLPEEPVPGVFTYPPPGPVSPSEPVIQPPPAAQAYPLPSDRPAYTPPYAPPYVGAARPPKDRALAIIAEALPGLFGFLGIGWLYAGNTTTGILVLLGFLAWNFIAVILDLLTVGFFLCLHLPANLVAVLASSFLLYNTTKKQPGLFGR